MKNNQKKCLLKLTLAITLIGLLLAIPLSVQAKSVTQLAFLQTLVQISGDGGQFGPSSSAQDFVQWAQAKGMSPAGGWNLSGTLTKDQLAQLLVQLLNLNPKKGGGDYERILKREGIDLGAADEISSATLVSVLGNGSFPTRLPGSPVKGNNGLGNGQDPPPPGFLNPRNPHFGGGQNDGPGTSPGNPNPHNKP